MRLNELHLILLCFLCAGAALLSPIDYAWIGPVSRSRWLAALAFALCVVSGSDPTPDGMTRAPVLTSAVPRSPASSR